MEKIDLGNLDIKITPNETPGVTLGNCIPEPPKFTGSGCRGCNCGSNCTGFVCGWSCFGFGCV
ncbi:hypothetical protein M2349_000036 [Caldanaerobacter subterraneus subsp. tengcongensis MB4]|uniref:hypothetical protein n=1 Tax=Caldanaerobacter subterraneus TaxID=911092 RepID=UPI0005A11DE0|nr:hypothetical protein [Caldanaerobacter subterraneus]MCS3914895.1 hypothetical protein [Caldanaerobacter subterraneus subsp. tengcongensis MB4]